MKKIFAKIELNLWKWIAIGIVVFLVVFFVNAFYRRGVFSEKYKAGIEQYMSGNYETALEIFESIEDYKDVSQYIEMSEKGLIYMKANQLLNDKKYNEAIELFSQIIDYEDSINKTKEAKYKLAILAYNQDDYDTARKIFTELGDYEDSIIYLAQIDVINIEDSKHKVYEKACAYYKDSNYYDAIILFETILDYKDANIMYQECEAQIMRRNFNNIVAAGVRTSFAITNKGTVVAAGDEGEDRCKVDEWNDIVSVDTYGCFTIGLTKSGHVKLAGLYDGGKVDTSKWDNIIDIAAGERFIVGLKSDGTVVADGHNSNRQIDISEWKNVIAIDAGWSYTVGLTEDKELVFSGIDNGQKEEFEQKKDEWVDVVNISASGGGTSYRGRGHTVGLRKDGTVVAVGDNRYGQCEVSDWKDIIKIATGDWYTVGLKADGTILITGENEPGNKYIEYDALEVCTDIVDIAAGYGHTLCLHKDGTVTAFGFNENGKCSDTIGWSELMIPEIKKNKLQ